MWKMDEWQRRRSRTYCAFDGSGYDRVLKNETYAAKNTQMNQVVYLQLSVVNIGVTSHYLIKQYEDDKIVYGAWNALCGWYDEYAVKNET